MEIHAPTGPTHSFKDFAIHILIVTIGILIALGLEGLRETWREHKAISEAGASFDQELRRDEQQLDIEVAHVRKASADLDRVISDLPELSKTPAILTGRVMGIEPGFYFFRTTAWESAVASGILSHMSERDLNRFDEGYLGIKHYQDAQKGTIAQWLAVRAYYLSHHSFTPAEEVAGEEKLRSLKIGLDIQEHLSGEFRDGLKVALGPK